MRIARKQAPAFKADEDRPQAGSYLQADEDRPQAGSYLQANEDRPQAGALLPENEDRPQAGSYLRTNESLIGLFASRRQIGNLSLHECVRSRTL